MGAGRRRRGNRKLGRDLVVKIVIFFKRKPGMSVEDFQQHWRTTHADIIVRLPGIRGYIQSHVLASGYRKGEPVYDGVAETYFDDTQAMKALARMPEYAAVLADEPNFIDGANMASIITDEYVIKDGTVSENAVKRIDFVNRKTGMSVDDFQKHWRETHGPLCRAAQATRRYVQNPTRRAIYDSGGTPPFDGVAMAWFNDTQALRAAAPTPEFERLRADLENFIARDRSAFVLTREHVILA
jgi:uncharacterized protein (TIGR02118 family)